ncbi:MAG: hypothetical protein CMH83_23270 [Nocardioides sp.]|nr:hypothetical protein [Nocardioides sp.]
MESVQYVVPLGVVVRGGVEVVVALVLAGICTAHRRSGAVAVVGLLAATLWALVVATFTVTPLPGAEARWSDWVWQHNDVLDWVRVAGMATAVISLGVLSVRNRQRRG